MRPTLPLAMLLAAALAGPAMAQPRPDPLAELRVYLEGFADELATLPCAIGVGRLQTHASPSLDDYIDELARHQLVLPVLDVDVRQRSDVILLIDTLLAQLEANLFGE